jgi:hypothetical protein
MGTQRRLCRSIHGAANWHWQGQLPMKEAVEKDAHAVTLYSLV